MQNPNRIIRTARIVMPLVALVCVIVFPPWNGMLAWLAPLPDTLQEQVDDAIDHGLDGIIVYVDQAGRAPGFYTAGWKDRAARVPADPAAIFKIGSISKLYIAVAVAKLIHSEELSLDTTLADYLPGLAGRIANAEHISLRMLLQHRSGIPDFIDQRDFDWSRSSMDSDAALGLILDKPANFSPDQRYRYSNTNYLLLGDILDKTLGYSHRLYIDREILTPLGLSHTFGLLKQADIGDVASGYHHPYEDDLKEIDFIIPGGSMVATAQDVGIFLRALNDGSLLSEAEQAVYSSIYEYEHTGWVLGYQSFARYEKDIDTVIVQFVNTTSEDGDAELTANVIYKRIIQILHKQ